MKTPIQPMIASLLLASLLVLPGSPRGALVRAQDENTKAAEDAEIDATDSANADPVEPQAAAEKNTENKGDVISDSPTTESADKSGGDTDTTATADNGAPSTMQAIDFKFGEGTSTLEVKFDHDVQYEKTVSDEGKQVIFEFKNAKIPQNLTRKLDTSSFKSKASLISPYQSGENVRVAIQLRESSDVDIAGDGKNFTAMIENLAGSAEAAPVVAQNNQTPNASSSESTLQPTTEAQASNVQLQTQTSVDGNLESFMKASENRTYVGRKINLQLKEADIHDVFQAISEASEFNIVLGDDVKGKITVNLTGVPWDQALDIILKSNKLAAERNGNVLRVATLGSMTKEKQAELANQKAVDAVEPLVVKIFPISYAKIDDLKKILDDFLSQDNEQASALATSAGSNASAAAQAAVSKRGSIQIDTRTNSLVVRDTATTIEKIKRIIKELDTQTPQILIEAKFVEVNESKAKGISGRLFATSREADTTTGIWGFQAPRQNYAAVFNGSTSPSFSDTFAGGISPVTGASFGYQSHVGIIPGVHDELTAFVNMTEYESSGKIIGTPRVVTQNKEAAEISQGTQYTVATTAGANSAGSFQTISATLNLKVTPQVTSDGSINLKVTFTQDTPASNAPSGVTLALDSKKVDTNVLVESGSTLVIGGIYTNEIRKSEGGIPLLRDLPLVGFLFGEKASTVDKRELFIFITPRIVNEKESGIEG